MRWYRANGFVVTVQQISIESQFSKYCSDMTLWNQSTISSSDSLSKIRKYSRTNSPSLGCCILCQSDWADYFTVFLLIDQHVGVLKIKGLFCFRLISGKQVNLSTPLRSEPTWAVTGMNWQVFTLTDYSRKRSWSWSCVKWINLKVRNDDISRRKYASIAKLSAFFPKRSLYGRYGKIIVVRGLMSG